MSTVIVFKKFKLYSSVTFRETEDRAVAVILAYYRGKSGHRRTGYFVLSEGPVRVRRVPQREDHSFLP